MAPSTKSSPASAQPSRCERAGLPAAVFPEEFPQRRRGAEARRPSLPHRRCPRLRRESGREDFLFSSLLFSSLLFSSLCLAHPIASRASDVCIPLTSVPPCLRERPMKRVSRTTFAQRPCNNKSTSTSLPEPLRGRGRNRSLTEARRHGGPVLHFAASRAY
jgi:hypothetical protein